MKLLIGLITAMTLNSALYAQSALDGMTLPTADLNVPGPEAVPGVRFPESGGPDRDGSLAGSSFEWARNQGAPIQGCMTPSQRMAACGPIAAEAMIRYFAKDAKMEKICEVWNLARNKGYWNGGMNGPASEQALLRDFGVEVGDPVWVTNIAPAERMVRESLDRGKPVILSTNRHYFFAEGYNGNGDLFVGFTGQIMSKYGGSAYMSLSRISQAGGGGLVLLIPR